MRNALIAIAIIVAGISANVVGPTSTPVSHSEATSGRAAHGGLPARRSKLLPEGHPLQILYKEDDDKEDDTAEPSGSQRGASPASGTLQVNVSNNQLKIEGTLSLAPEQKAEDCQGLPPLNNPDVRFLMAMVPDPEGTHLALMFDRHLESIMQAAQDSGYRFSRYSLPWRADAEAESSDPDIRKKNRQEKSAREALPGLMVFRNAQGALLAVFLVGEAPTAGVNRPQFSRAVCYIRQLGGKNKTADRTRADFFGILGPVFSGSFTSLEAAIEKPVNAALLAGHTIVSGTTTSKRAVEDFAYRHPTFSTTVRDDESAYCLLRQEYPGWERVAVLSEDGTGYGADWQVSEDCRKPLTSIYYPREISLLRNAYQDDPALAAAQNLPDSSARRQLLLPLRDSQSGRDTLPQFSVQQTPASQETVLFQISEAIRRERIQAAIVRGTNVLDTLFLSRFLRQCCGDLRVAVLDADLLFVHGTDSLDYLGVLAVESYPLRVEKNGRVFGSNDAAGAYYATKMLLAAPQDTRPPLWISVVGRGAYFPVAARWEPQGPPDQPAPGYPSRLWDAVFYTSSLLVVLYIATYVYAVHFCAQLPRWCSDFHPSPETANPGRAHYHLVTTVLLLAAYCALAFAPAYLAFVQHASPWIPSGCWAVLVTLALLFMTFDTAWRFAPTRLGFLAAALAEAGVLYCAFRLSPPGPSELLRPLFGAERSLDLTSGVAPSLPLVMLWLGLAYWAWINMQRFIFVEERDPQALQLQALPDLLIERFKDPLQRPIFAGSWPRATVLLLTVCLSGYLGSLWLASLESRGFDRLFLALLTICGGLLLLTAWGFFRVWARLHRALLALDLHPIRFAFAALPAVSTWSPLWQPTAGRRSYTIPERVLETARQLESVDPQYHPDLSRDRGAIENQLDPLLHTFNRGLREGAADAHRMSTLQNELAQKLGTVLETSAWRQGSSATVVKIEEDLPKHLPDDKQLPGLLAAEMIAIRYLALIRYVMLHLKNQLSFMTVGFILLAISLNCYSFEGEGYFRWWLTAIFLILSVTGIVVFVEMEHDPTLSRLTDTSTGKLDPSFYVKVLSAGALPLLAVVSSQFPGIGRFLFSWLQPALSALH